MSWKDHDFKENALKSNLKPTSTAYFRDHQAMQDNLRHIYFELNQVLVIPNAASGKTAEIHAL